LNHSATAGTKQSGKRLLDDTQHVLEAYFTEIEESCNAAAAEIDEKFQEILSLITSEQQQFHRKIERWKLDKLESVNREISDLKRFRNASGTEMEGAASKYSDCSKLAQHIEAITPLMSVQIDAAAVDRVHSAISSMVEIAPKRSISFPAISVSKPHRFTAKNDGYSVRLSWSMRGHSKAINKDRFTLKYKMGAAVHGDDGKEESARPLPSEWSVFKHGVIGDTAGDGEVAMSCQTLDVLRPNQRYFCQIEYAVQQPLEITVASNIEQFVNLQRQRLTEGGNLRRIKLEHHSHRKHSLTRHPKHLLLSSDTKQYWSAFNSDFERDEVDWMVFQYKERKKWVPRQIVFKNYKSNQDVKRMMVFVGDAKQKQWRSLTTEPMEPKLTKDLQYFEVDSFELSEEELERFRFLKVEFLENYGESNPEMCRFCCRHFSLMGTER